MYKKALTVLGTLGAISSAQALQFGNIQVYTYVAPYFTYINYDNSDIKKDGWSTTLYGSLSFMRGIHVLEWAYGYNHLNYKNNYGSWNQNDYVLKYTNYQFFPWYGSIGVHYIASPNTDISERATVLILDGGYIQKYNWNVGAEYSYGDYKYGLATQQLRLHGGKYLYTGPYRGFYFEGSLYWNYVNKKYVPQAYWYIQNELNKKNYYSLGYSVTYFTPKYSIKVKSWLGERVFAVDNGGFVVYNLKERYYSSSSITGTYYFNTRLNASLELGLSSYREVTTDRGVKVYTITASVGYSF
jgi:hypothetical protein